MSLLSNAKWNSFSQLFKIGVQFVNIIYLARVISPADYGLLAMALVVTNFGVLLRDLGTNAALIQRKLLTDELKNTVFWLNTLMGLILAVIICLISPLVSSLYSEPKLINILILLSVIFPLSSSASAHLALLERKSKFKIISCIEIVSSLLSVTTAIVMANLGFGVYSLVVQAIVINFVSAVFFWYVSDWRPKLKNMIDLGEAKSIFRFSANLSLFNMINYFSRNADSFIIGKFMSVFVLGSYNLAYRIMLFPLQSLTFVASRSLYPILSKHQDDNVKISSTYLQCVFVILMITAPLMSGIAMYSHQIIFLFFGEKWSLTASILFWLAPTAIIQSVLSTTGAVFTAKGKTSLMMRLGLVGAILQVGAFIIGVHYSIVEFSFLYFVANIINFVPTTYFLLTLIDTSFIGFFKKIMPIFFSTVMMILFLFFLKKYFILIDSHDGFFKLFVSSSLGGGVYFLVMFSICKEFRFYLFFLLKRYLNKKRS